MPRTNLFAMLLVLALTVSMGCGQAPTELKQATETAMNDARNAQADKYAPDSFAKAQATYDQAQAEESAQNQKFALVRSYKKATELLNQAKMEFEQSVQDATAGKERVRAEAEQAINDAKTAMDAADAALKTAPMSKDTRADVDAMKSDAATYRQALTDAEAALNTQDYLTAKSKAESVKAKADEITAAVEEAKAKMRGGR